MIRRGKSLAITLAVLIAFWLIWSRLRIVVWVQASFWQILLVFVVLAAALFLGIDHLLNRTRDEN
jgi:type VI protein secretion system component VasF